MRETDVAPIFKRATVALGVEDAFRLFTEGIAEWWPHTTHSVGFDEVESLHFEARPHGRILEVWKDGREFEWGRVVTWEPPARVVFSWKPSPERTAYTEIEVSFVPDGEGTSVELVHRNWANLGDDAAESRMDYDTGWDTVFGAYAAKGNEPS
jgi:uncharacterized protein YndB with AHSA1/START domain